MNSLTDSVALCTAIGRWWVAEGVKGWKPSHSALAVRDKAAPASPCLLCYMCIAWESSSP